MSDLTKETKPKMPRAPLKLASAEDVSRYLTTIAKMLHNDLITPQKATALRGLCMAKLDSFKQNKDTGTKIQINIGLPMGSGRTDNDVVEVSGESKRKKRAQIEVKSPFSELEQQITEVLEND